MRKLILLFLAGLVFRQLARRNPALARFAPLVSMLLGTRRGRPL